MRIIIIGGGIAGLSTYLQLIKRLGDGYAITILEKHASQTDLQDDSASTFAGGLGIAPNGMRVLRQLDQSIYSAVKESGFTVLRHEFRTSGGYLIGEWPAASNKEPTEGTVMIQRKSLWKILRRQVPDTAIRQNAAVKEVRLDGSLLLEDGNVMTAHLIVGADGVWSIARHAVVEEDEQGRHPEFQKLMNVGGSVAGRRLDTASASPKAVCTMTFGATGFFGYTRLSTGKDGHGMWWSTYSDVPEMGERRTTNRPIGTQLRLDFCQRHTDWADGVIRAIATDLMANAEKVANGSSEADRASLDLHTPTWVIPTLPRWSRGRVVLVGDAAHALPSTSGQGVSQALEDSAVLVREICRACGGSEEPRGEFEETVVRAAAEAYEMARRPRVEKILLGALRMQNSKHKLSRLETVILYVVLWVIIRVGGGRQEAWKFDHDCEEDDERDGKP